MGVVAPMTVLVAEDEPGVRNYLQRVLETRGFRVLAAADGAAALEIARAFAGDIDLVCTDVVMPRMSGPRLSAALAEEGRRPRVLYVTGYPEFVLAGLKAWDSPYALLHKPFTRTQLLQGVREALEGPSPSRRWRQPAPTRTAVVVSAEATFRHFLARTLRSDGWTVLAA